MTMSLPENEYKSRVLGALLGKAVGGTLGMPYEGVRRALDLTYYDPIPRTMEPNDDLDLQVVYAVLMDRMDPVRVDRRHLTAAWEHIGMSPDEYGICKRNLQLGLVPPATGAFDNPFTDGMGAAIRTELWACLAAGNPELAAQYAFEDACMDHAGEGIHAARFLAALQSMAFVDNDRDRLLDRATDIIPIHSKVRQAIADTRAWWRTYRDWREVRRRIKRTYPTDNFTDVTINLSFIVLGWLAGEGDFGRSICIAANCGEDTDCTAATLGALLGILDPGSIDGKWLRPIGRNLVLSPSVRGIKCPPTLDEFLDLILSLRRRLDGRPPETVDSAPIGIDPVKLAIRAQVGFSRSTAIFEQINAPPVAPEMPEPQQEVILAGCWTRWPWERCAGETMYVKYRIHVDRPRSIRLLFNTPEPVRVWFDGKWAFGRDQGEFLPAFHRPPINQSAIIDVPAGLHEVLAVILRPQEPRPVQWCIGVSEVSGSPVCDRWLADAFERVG